MRKHRRLDYEHLETRELLAGNVAQPLIPPRSLDGTGNNLQHPEWGSTGEQFLRTTTAEYSDGVSAVAGVDRASPREISNLVAAQSESILNQRQLSDLAWQWGQFLDHDLDLTLPANPAEPASIAVPSGDLFFDPSGTGTATIGLNRSGYDPATGDSASNPREQINSITAWIDGSMIYGSDDATAASLREFAGGRLKTSEGNLLPQDANGNFQAGDIRVNEQIGLTAMQTLFMREHNRIADELARQHPGWTDEQLYQRARAIVIAQVQVITYKEFLPALLGPDALPAYRGYNPNINPGISNVFATAAFRLGHSQLSPQLLRLNNDGSVIAEGNIALRDAFFASEEVLQTGIEPILKGLATQQAQELDTQIIDDVRNFLFGPPGAGGFDLASLNIQRGRDHGLADYNQTRIELGLRPVQSFAQITSDPELQAKLQQAYGDVNNIDVWVGALAEDHVRGGSVGPLMRAVLVDQFVRLRDGDRFWHQRTFSGDELRRIEGTTLSSVILRNTSLTNLQRQAFFTPEAAQNQNPPPRPKRDLAQPAAPLDSAAPTRTRNTLLPSSGFIQSAATNRVPPSPAGLSTAAASSTAVQPSPEESEATNAATRDHLFAEDVDDLVPRLLGRGGAGVTAHRR